MRILLRVATAIFVCLAAMPLAAQTSSAQQPKAGTDTSKQGIPLQTDLTVQSNITVQAVLIPQKIAKAVFGGKISSEYAVVQLTINNKSPDAALIVQGVYIDYTQWALAGGGISTQPCSEASSTDPQSKFTHCTESSQVASEEYRVVRGQALNAQTWTWRNGIVRGLTLAGSVAGAYAFTVSGTKYPKAVAGATGTFIPGLGTFWPDQTIDQINRISDLGYQTNKVISKQGSDIIVCFFPIDRFLTEGFRELFLKYPALFFAPYEMLVDKKVQGEVLKVVPEGFFGIKFDEMTKALPCYLEKHKPAVPQDASKPGTKEGGTGTAAEEIPKTGGTGCQIADGTKLALDALARVSLNTIRVVVDGVMTVDTTTMRAKIDSVVIDKDTETGTWTVSEGATGPTVTGTITGSYLTSGTPVIQEAKADQITKVQAVTEGSNDQTLKFSFVLGKGLNAGDHLTFVVEKATKDSKTAPVDSTPFLYVVPPLHAADSSAGTNKQDSGAQTGKTAGGGGTQPSGAPSTPGATKPTEEKKQAAPPAKK